MSMCERMGFTNFVSLLFLLLCRSVLIECISGLLWVYQ